MKVNQCLRWIGACIDASASVVSRLPLAKRVIPAGVRQRIWTLRHALNVYPPRGWVQFGKLRTVTPVSRLFGYDRGLPVDRYFIEGFLSANETDIKGRVLEVADSTYTRQFGGQRVTEKEVLHVCAGNPKATIVADLTSGDTLPSNSFDCIILTQTLQFIYELRPAVQTLHRILKPGGVLLLTVPGISQISRYDMERWGDHWRFTTLSAQKLFQEVFSPADIRTLSYGNVLAANALLHGLAAEDLRRDELEYHDPDYELLVAVRAVKPRRREHTQRAGMLPDNRPSLSCFLPFVDAANYIPRALAAESELSLNEFYFGGEAAVLFLLLFLVRMAIDR
jgi:SAM-dependent methyltransferase